MNDYYECGDGWIPLIEHAKYIVNLYNKEHPELEEPLDFVQIKEKWGGLCLYLNQYVPEVSNKIHGIEAKSFHVCENCGVKTNVKTKDTHGWLMTLCDKCREEELNKYEKIYNKK